MFELGSQVQDKVTSFIGTVTARCEYLDGTITYQVQPPLGEKGKYEDSRWFAQGSLEQA